MGLPFKFPFPFPGPSGSPLPTPPVPVPGASGQPSPIPFPFPFPNPSPAPGPQPDAGAFPTSWTAFEDEVLARTNQTRAQGVVCGNQSMPPAPPVAPNSQLQAAARAHSRDMATRNFFDHSNPDGRDPSDRARSAGYNSTFVGENIAAGQTTPAEVVQAWIKSPGHCVNMMDPRYKVLGVGYFFEGQGDEFHHYWTQDFGG